MAARKRSTSVLTPRFTTSKPAPSSIIATRFFSNIVDVALDRADHHLSHFRRAGLGQQRAQDRHAGFHGVGGEQDFGDEQDAVAKILADDAHALDQGLGEHAIGAPSRGQAGMFTPSSISSFRPS